jgi:hypothetical protein
LRKEFSLQGLGHDFEWSDWKRYPRPGRGENIEAPITPGIYEVRIAGSARCIPLKRSRT